MLAICDLQERCVIVAAKGTCQVSTLELCGARDLTGSKRRTNLELFSESSHHLSVNVTIYARLSKPRFINRVMQLLLVVVLVFK